MMSVPQATLDIPLRRIAPVSGVLILGVGTANTWSTA